MALALGGVVRATDFRDSQLARLRGSRVGLNEAKPILFILEERLLVCLAADGRCCKRASQQGRRARDRHVGRHLPARRGSISQETYRGSHHTVGRSSSSRKGAHGSCNSSGRLGRGNVNNISNVSSIPLPCRPSDEMHAVLVRTPDLCSFCDIIFTQHPHETTCSDATTDALGNDTEIHSEASNAEVEWNLPHLYGR